MLHSTSYLKVLFARALWVGCGRVSVFVTLQVVPFADGQAAIETVGVGVGMMLDSGAVELAAFVGLLVPSLNINT